MLLLYKQEKVKHMLKYPPSKIAQSLIFALCTANILAHAANASDISVPVNFIPSFHDFFSAPGANGNVTYAGIEASSEFGSVVNGSLHGTPPNPLDPYQCPNVIRAEQDQLSEKMVQILQICAEKFPQICLTLYTATANELAAASKACLRENMQESVNDAAKAAEAELTFSTVLFIALFGGAGAIALALLTYCYHKPIGEKLRSASSAMDTGARRAVSYFEQLRGPQESDDSANSPLVNSSSFSYGATDNDQVVEVIPSDDHGSPQNDELLSPLLS